MNKKLTCTFAIVGLLFGTLAYADGINLSVILDGQIAPGVYGRVELGDARPPPLVFRDPLWVRRPRHPPQMEPLYLHVPPGHAKRWSRYCGRYQACDRPVYFVRSREYEPGYRPGPPPPPPRREWRDERREGPPLPPPGYGPGRYEDRDDRGPPPPPREYREERRDDYRGDDDRDDRRDRDHGKGHDKGRD